MRRVLPVFLGGGLGAALRAVLLAALVPANDPFPLIVLAINLLGSFLLGLIYALADEVGLLRATTRLFLAVGVLGGFTTFSTFGWGADLLAPGHFALAAGYVLASVVGGVVAAFGGILAGRELVELTARVAHGILQRLAAGGHVSGPAAYDMAAIELEDREGTG